MAPHKLLFVDLYRSPETENLATELARLTDETKREAVTKAVRDRLERVKRERHRRSLKEAIESAERRLLSAATFVETSMVLESRQGGEGVRALDRLIAAAGIETVAVNSTQAIAAREAFRKSGKGRHPAALNFGDCFSYAIARCLTEPLLFKGNNLSQTDVLIG